MTDYTPQTEWIERRGILVWIAEVCTSIGSGLYLISLFFSLVPGYEKISWWGMLIAWLIIMFLKIPLHLAYFGKPLRFWRTIPPFSNGWKTSWFARGIIFSILFGTFAFIQIVFSFLKINPLEIGGLNFSADILAVFSALDILFKVLGGITAFLTGIYPGFIMNYVKGIQFWNSALLPVVLIMGGILDGCAFLLAITKLFSIDTHTVELVSSILLVVNIFFIAVYLLSATYMGAAAKVSAMKLVKDNLAPTFWIGVIVLGMIVPLAISLFALTSGESSPLLLIIAIITHTIGAFTLKYCLLKVGIYRPLFTVQARV